MNRAKHRTPADYLEAAALRMPHEIRQLLANWKSWQLDRLRRGGNWAALREEYGPIRYSAMTWEEMRQEQDHRLARLLRRAARYTSYYRAMAPALEQVESVEQLGQLPTLSKEQARQAGEQILDEELRHEKHYTGHTSGTTGSPFTVKSTLETLRIRYALRDNFYAFHGFDFGRQLNLRLGGRLFISTSRKRPPFWILDRVTGQLMFSLYHMSEENFSYFIEPLLRYRPAFVTGYPSAVYLIARFCQEQKVDWRPAGVFTDAETVLDYQRDAVFAAWDCEIHDYYGMEVGWIAGQCKRGKYHLSPLTSVVEILDDDDQPAAPGELGEIVATDLTNPLMPLIRYRTGDMARWSTQPCACGWNTPTLDLIEGRMDDIVVLPDGRKIGRLDHIFKTATNIRECQIIQETERQFTFLVVPEEAYRAADGDALLREAHLRLGNDVAIDIRLVDRVPRTNRGKFRAVISRVSAGS